MSARPIERLTMSHDTSRSEHLSKLDSTALEVAMQVVRGGLKPVTITQDMVGQVMFLPPGAVLIDMKSAQSPARTQQPDLEPEAQPEGEARENAPASMPKKVAQENIRQIFEANPGRELNVNEIFTLFGPHHYKDDASARCSIYNTLRLMAREGAVVSHHKRTGEGGSRIHYRLA